MTPSSFDAIRAYEPQDLPKVFAELLDDPQFLPMAAVMTGGASKEQLAAALQACRTPLDFQKKFFYSLIKKEIIGKHTRGVTLDLSALTDYTQHYTFISNHRDIVLDAGLFDVLLIDTPLADTVEIAIGDNLLAYPWIEKLVRLNRAFIVRRSLSIREMLEGSRLLSEYMHYAVAQKGSHLWIAQREGRAKDSDDRTQESVLKMMAMGGEGSAAERLRALHLVPMAISYEYDPCDYLKAKEFQQKRDTPAFKKSREDDLQNMQTGIFGDKGRVHYAVAPCIDTWLSEVEDLPKSDFFAAVAARIDRDIHARYRLYAGNFAALDLLEGTSAFADRYTAEERTTFETYIEGRLALIDLPNKDEAFLRERLLTMYANPVRNWLKTQ